MRELLDRLDGWRDEQIEFLARLVNHDSGTDDPIDANRVAAILVERLERLGFAVRRTPQERFGDHLLGEKPGTGPKRFLFVGHYDTVFPSGTAKARPFRIDAEGRAWAPGVYDMKGGAHRMQAAGRDLGLDVRAIKTGGGSDGNHTSAVAPTIDGLGPRGSRAHSADEFIEVATLLERTKMIALFLDRWAAEFAIA